MYVSNGLKICTIVVCISLLAGCKNEQRKDTLLQDADSLWYYKGELYTGKFYTLHNSHRKIDFLDYVMFKPDKEFQRAKEIEVINGKYHGQAIGFFETGEISVKGNYLNNRKVGNWVSFYRNGVKAHGTKFVSGEMHFDTLFDKKGEIWITKTRINSNTFERKCYLGDEVISRGNYINDKKVGLHYEKEGNGDVWEGEYKDGLKHGKWTVVYSDGRKSKVNYINGKKEVPAFNGESPIRQCQFCGKTFYATLKSESSLSLDNYGNELMKNIINNDPKLKNNPFAHMLTQKPSRYETQPYCTPKCEYLAKKSGYDAQRKDVLRNMLR